MQGGLLCFLMPLLQAYIGEQTYGKTSCHIHTFPATPGIDITYMLQQGR